MKPSELSKELREGNSPLLQNRRAIVALSFVGIAAAKIVSLYQVGIIKKLPDPPISIFDSSKVNASDYAYKRFATPDALLMLISYSMTAWLASAGRQNREKRNPLWTFAMTGKILFDVLTAVELAREEWDENKKLCAYCQSATIASIASLLLAIPEAKAAIRRK
ncbi:MAG TPA: vitamin K epoxide reductase family protein [Abditibacterium sp.]|jgi:uncharacterized membrane protein